MKVTDRFLKYVTINTQSSETSGTHPSFSGEFDFAKILAAELTEMGFSKVRVSDKCYVFAELPATAGYEKVPALGLISHMDTSCAASGKDVKPRIVRYNGTPIELGNGKFLDAQRFHSLNKHVGKELIVTDGSTLLGGDNKAGVAEIMTAMNEIIFQNIPHGRLCIGFTPDEEIGEGPDFFDIKEFGAEYAYTVDGGCPNEIEYSNFNAAAVKITVHGLSVHPGAAKDVMKNAQKIGFEFNSMLPPEEVPEHTEGREGFYHLTGCEGDVTEFTLNYILRDHDCSKFEQRKKKCQEITGILNHKYGENTVECQIREQYRNMEEIIDEKARFLVDYAMEAVHAEGMNPSTPPIRGGTDGARLSFMGLPCPNIGTGTYNMHGVYEYTVIDEMNTMVRVILRIVRKFAEK